MKAMLAILSLTGLLLVGAGCSSGEVTTEDVKKWEQAEGKDGKALPPESGRDR